MRRYWRFLQVGAVAAVLVAGALPVAAQHTDRRGGGGDGGARSRSGDSGNSGGSNTPSRGRASDGGHRVESAPPSDHGAQNDGARQRRENPPARASGDSGRDQRASGDRGRDNNNRERDQRASGDRGRDNNGGNNRGGGYYNPNDGRNGNRGDAYRRDDGRPGPPTNYAYRRDPRENRGGPYYGVPRSRILPNRRFRPHVYGPGGNLSIYFGWGTGYRYGSPYYGRVYGYSEPYSVYDARRYYGDVRLMVTPRWAAVYVDGYYAGVVDDFDGFFQRLTVEVGPHEIEVDAPGYEPQYFDVYVDPERTIDLRGDLYPLR